MLLSALIKPLNLNDEAFAPHISGQHYYLFLWLYVYFFIHLFSGWFATTSRFIDSELHRLVARLMNVASAHSRQVSFRFISFHFVLFVSFSIRTILAWSRCIACICCAIDNRLFKYSFFVLFFLTINQMVSNSLLKRHKWYRSFDCIWCSSSNIVTITVVVFFFFNTFIIFIVHTNWSNNNIIMNFFDKLSLQKQSVGSVLARRSLFGLSSGKLSSSSSTNGQQNFCFLFLFLLNAFFCLVTTSLTTTTTIATAIQSTSSSSSSSSSAIDHFESESSQVLIKLCFLFDHFASSSSRSYWLAICERDWRNNPKHTFDWNK